ncbi:E3 ubiquitin-protein ligase TRIM11-like [Notamacropus eugenii]|uniref:E3 ubiquitin-protein ligase TRIM11-like n=1 Tax=Notamacropus eugenii TaxID=9315 RepID=UPI003B674DDF
MADLQEVGTQEEEHGEEAEETSLGGSIKRTDTPPCQGASSALGLCNSLQNLLTCPVCRNYFNEPITMFSGNTICQSCHPEGCPPAHINWKMKKIVNLFKELKPLLEPQPVPEGWCPKHDEPFTLLCQEDNQRICQICQYCSLHNDHTLTILQDPKAHEDNTGSAQEKPAALKELVPSGHQHSSAEEETMTSLPPLVTTECLSPGPPAGEDTGT